MKASAPKPTAAAAGHAGDTVARTNAIHSRMAPPATTISRPFEMSRLIRSSAAIRSRLSARRRSYSARGSFKERPRERHVVVGCRVQFRHRHVFLRGVRDVDRAGTEE